MEITPNFRELKNYYIELRLNLFIPPQGIELKAMDSKTDLGSIYPGIQWSELTKD